MESQALCLDLISNLPQNIIDTILCLVPIEEAVRTSILSKEWRYKWTKIPKLVFDEDTFEVPTDDENQLSVLEQTFDIVSDTKRMAKRYKAFSAINQVMLLHQGPIVEFTLAMDANHTCLDQIITHLLRNNTLKKLTLELNHEDKLPSSVFLLHRLTDLYLHHCDVGHQPTFNGFGSLTTLYLHDVNISTETLLHLASSCPLLKSFSLLIDENHILGHSSSTIIELIECLHVIEHLTIWSWVIECFAQCAVPRELPTSLLHLKYFCLEDICFIGKYGLPFLFLLIRSSPHLEKIKLQILSVLGGSYRKSVIDAVTLRNYSDVWLENLNELVIEDFGNLKPELEFVKLILDKSPVLKNVRILLDHEVTTDEESKIIRLLLRSPHASPMVEISVDRRDIFERVIFESDF